MRWLQGQQVRRRRTWLGNLLRSRPRSRRRMDGPHWFRSQTERLRGRRSRWVRSRRREPSRSRPWTRLWATREPFRFSPPRWGRVCFAIAVALGISLICWRPEGHTSLLRWLVALPGDGLLRLVGLGTFLFPPFFVLLGVRLRSGLTARSGRAGLFLFGLWLGIQAVLGSLKALPGAESFRLPPGGWLGTGLWWPVVESVPLWAIGVTGFWGLWLYLEVRTEPQVWRARQERFVLEARRGFRRGKTRGGVALSRSRTGLHRALVGLGSFLAASVAASGRGFRQVGGAGGRLVRGAGREMRELSHELYEAVFAPPEPLEQEPEEPDVKNHPWYRGNRRPADAER